MAELRQGAKPPAVRIATFFGLFIIAFCDIIWTKINELLR